MDLDIKELPIIERWFEWAADKVFVDEELRNDTDHNFLLDALGLVSDNKFRPKHANVDEETWRDLRDHMIEEFPKSDYAAQMMFKEEIFVVAPWGIVSIRKML